MTARRRLTASLAAALALLPLTQCSLVVKTDLRGGIGAACQSSGDCQGGTTCDEGSCTVACQVDDDCEAPAVCAAATDRCRLPLHVAAAFSGIANGGEGWTTSVRVGLDAAATSLGYLRFTGQAQGYAYTEQVRTDAQVDTSIDGYVSQGADVIVVNSATQVPPVLQRATQYPNTKFITVGGLEPNDTNVGSVFGRNDQSWMVAGQLTAREAKRCIGLIVPLPQTAPVRSINAFVLGVQREKPDMKVILRWMGFWKDINPGPTFAYHATNNAYDSEGTTLYREELLAAELVDLGCDVVAHKTDTQRTVAFIDSKLTPPHVGYPVFSLAADLRDGCRTNYDPTLAWLPTCFGSVYWNWGPILTQQLDAIHRGQWTPANIIEPMTADDSSITGFAMNPNVQQTGIEPEDATAAIIASVNAGPAAVWVGPYDTTGQRDADGDGVPDPAQSVPAGQSPSDAELNAMCWFVKGIYEETDYTDRTLADVVPAQVPHGMDPSKPADVAKYGDVIDFVTSLKMDPLALNCGQ